MLYRSIFTYLFLAMSLALSNPVIAMDDQALIDQKASKIEEGKPVSSLPLAPGGPTSETEEEAIIRAIAESSKEDSTVKTKSLVAEHKTPEIVTSKAFIYKFVLGADSVGGGLIPVYGSRKTTPFCCRRLPFVYLAGPSSIEIRFDKEVDAAFATKFFDFIDGKIADIYKERNFSEAPSSTNYMTELRFEARLEYEEVEELIDEANRHFENSVEGKALEERQRTEREATAKAEAERLQREVIERERKALEEKITAENNEKLRQQRAEQEAAMAKANLIAKADTKDAKAATSEVTKPDGLVQDDAKDIVVQSRAFIHSFELGNNKHDPSGMSARFYQEFRPGGMYHEYTSPSLFRVRFDQKVTDVYLEKFFQFMNEFIHRYIDETGKEKYSIAKQPHEMKGIKENGLCFQVYMSEEEFKVLLDEANSHFNQ